MQKKLNKFLIKFGFLLFLNFFINYQFETIHLNQMKEIKFLVDENENYLLKHQTSNFTKNFKKSK